MSESYSGGCFCGNVRYEFDGDPHLAIDCHCTMCRRAHGAPYVSWLVVPAERFRYTGAQPRTLHSSDHGTRWFCPRCGTHVTCANDGHPDIIDVSLGSLDQPEMHAPTRELFTETKLPWLTGRKNGGGS